MQKKARICVAWLKFRNCKWRKKWIFSKRGERETGVDRVWNQRSETFSSKSFRNLKLDKKWDIFVITRLWQGAQLVSLKYVSLLQGAFKRFLLAFKRHQLALQKLQLALQGLQLANWTLQLALQRLQPSFKWLQLAFKKLQATLLETQIDLSTF